MLPLSEIAGLAATLRGRGSSVADVVAAAWGVPPGVAAFWRSSASHVFVLDGAYLRFGPAGWRSGGGLGAVAGLMRAYGSAAAQPRPSMAGRLVETVRTARGPVCAMLVAAAPGEAVELEELGAARAREWGAALARVHRDAPELADLPGPFGDLDRAADVLAGDRRLVAAIGAIRAELDRLPRDAGCFGVTHGDFELDNLAWQGEHVTAYDFDEAAHSWYAADIAHALRDLPAGSPLTAAFLAGYRGIRPMPDADLARMPLFAAAHTAGWLVRLPAVLDTEAAPADPGWLRTLRTKLIERGVQQRALVLGAYGA